MIFGERLRLKRTGLTTYATARRQVAHRFTFRAVGNPIQEKVTPSITVWVPIPPPTMFGSECGVVGTRVKAVNCES